MLKIVSKNINFSTFKRSSWGPTGILHLTLIMCSVQAILFIVMWSTSRKTISYINDTSLEEDKETIALKEQIDNVDT